MHKLTLDDVRLRTLPNLLYRQAQENGGQQFLLSGDASLTFGEAETLSNQLAGGLASLGVRTGDTVALYLRNRLEMVLLTLAINKLGAIWVPVNTDYHGTWLKNTIVESHAKVLVTEDYLWQKNQEHCPAENLVVLDSKEHISYEDLLDNEPIECDLRAFDYGDTCSIMWTSGTTGKSKGVMMSHNNWVRPIVDGSSVFYQTQPGDVILNVLPMYHAAAWTTAILRALIEGIPVALETKYSVSNFLQRVKHYGATQTFTLGAMHMFLWNSPEDRQADRDHTLRCLQAVPMPADIKNKFEKRFGVQVLGSGYGQSECMLITTEAGFTGAPPNSMGFAARDLDIELFDENDQPVAMGEVGEIRIQPKQPNIICNGYFNNPEATEQAWKGDWFCTGDMAKQVAGGAYYFCDRKKDAVRYAGRNISTLEVESVVRQNPDVADVAAFGIESQEMAAEDELALAIVLRENAQTTAEEIATLINQNAPYYFVPRYIEFVDQLPYTPTNKIQKFKLRQQGVTGNTWDRKSSEFVISR